MAITELSRAYGNAWGSFDGAQREHLISEFSSGELTYDLIDRHREVVITRCFPPSPPEPRLFRVLDIVNSLATGILWVMGIFAAIIALYVGTHVVPAIMSRDSPPVACQFTGGTWNLWTGWNC